MHERAFLEIEDAFARVAVLLASVVDTCRQRNHAPWRYLERAIADRRAELPLPPLPQ